MKTVPARTIPLLTLLLIPAHGWASFDLKTASYQKTFQDSAVIQRTYNSRSLHEGYFGLGWCSEFEIKLKFDDIRPHPTICDLEFKNQTLKPENGFFNWNQEYIFDFKGRLIKKILKNTKIFELEYDSENKIKSLLDANNDTWKVEWEDGRIKEFKKANSKPLTYSYIGMNLSQISNGWSYEYDNYNNLVKARSPDSVEIIKYDTENDRMIHYQDPEGCSQDISYLIDPVISTHFKSKVKKSCPSQKPKLIEYEFWLNEFENEFQKLKQFRVKVGDQSQEFIIDPMTGTPTKAIKP